MIRVLIADDQELLRDGLRMIIDAQDDMEVVAEAANGREAVRLARLRRPDVVLMDVRMPEMDGIDATRQLHLRADGPRVLVLTTFDLDEYVYEAMRAGATGFLLKSAPRHQLLSAVRGAAAGDVLLAPEITKRLVERFVTSRQGPPPAELDRLTSREHEVLGLLARGHTNSEIAAALHLADTTVKSHVSGVLAKLGLRDRVQAVVYAYEIGLVQPRSGA